MCTKFISRAHSSPLLQSLNRHIDLSWGKKIPLLMAQKVKNLPSMQETQVQFLGWEDPPGEGNGNPLRYSFPGEFHRQTSLAGYNSPWGRRESDTTERLALFEKRQEMFPTLLFRAKEWKESLSMGGIKEYIHMLAPFAYPLILPLSQDLRLCMPLRGADGL